MTKVYLREVKSQRALIETSISIFEGDIKQDKEYLIKHHNAVSVRYFELKEVKA